ncbi:MAG: carboxymuconolactone decarboxylase family protein [Thaumarchaeota archaeon]|nr:carboxymuconolactone decarboxylase family protein [Nitrososphaerota archaeon]
MAKKQPSGKLSSEELIEKMKKERFGRLSDAHLHLAERDPEFMQTYDDLFQLLMTRERQLTIKQKELIVIGMLAVKGQFAAMRTHVKRARKSGVTENQILEALELAMMYGGTESMIHGTLAMLEAVAESK